MFTLKEVMPEDKTLLQSYLRQIPSYLTEHSFTTLLAWQKSFQFLFGQWEDFLLIRNTHRGVTSFFPPFPRAGRASKESYRAALEEILAYCREEGLPCVLSEVGERELPLIEAAMPGAFAVRKDRNNANYIYRVEDLIRLEGKKYHSKRNHLNSFKRNYPFYEYRALTPDLIPACRESMERWEWDNPATDRETVKEEAEAMEVLFGRMEELGLKGACILLGDKVEAFTIGEAMSEEMVSIIIEKANTSCKGSYAAINQMFLAAEWREYPYVNRAEDMGLANLRRAKMDYQPCWLAMKYILEYRNGTH